MRFTAVCPRCGRAMPPIGSEEYVSAVEDEGGVSAVHSACLTDEELDARNEVFDALRNQRREED